MFVSENMILEMEIRYGRPIEKEFLFDISENEFKRIKDSKKDGRNHDVTLYIRKDDKIVVIAKPFYPEGLYRAPSGGLNKGESFDDGIAREVAEEVGVKIDLKRFLIKTSVIFRLLNERNSIYWRSFVFLADYLSGNFEYTDTHEIAEVRLADWSEFDNFGKIMRETSIGGLHYRAKLHEAVLESLQPDEYRH